MTTAEYQRKKAAKATRREMLVNDWRWIVAASIGTGILLFLIVR